MRFGSVSGVVTQHDHGWWLIVVLDTGLRGIIWPGTERHGILHGGDKGPGCAVGANHHCSPSHGYSSWL